MTLEQINAIVNGKIVESFSYAINKEKSYKEIVTYVEPDIEVINQLVRNGFSCTINSELYEVGMTRKMYCINHQLVNEYEWC